MSIQKIKVPKENNIGTLELAQFERDIHIQDRKKRRGF